MLQKLFRSEQSDEKRYSPAVCIGTKQETIVGSPDPKHISTSYVERQSLKMRMSMRRFTRADECLQQEGGEPRGRLRSTSMWYNFGRMHQTLRVTPAMEAGVADHDWTVEEIGGLLG